MVSIWGFTFIPATKTGGAGLGSGGRTKNSARQETYNKIFRQQLTEVLTKYKSMKEVWFDGSCVIDISDILQKYASDAVIFQGPQATIRWVGNERGIAPYPNWYTVKQSDLKTGISHALHSDPEGNVYAPVEVDVPFLMNERSYRWFWAPNTDEMILSVTDLMNIYNKSVGRGSVLLLNATPDTTGLIPTSHVKRYREFGKELSRRFRYPISSCSGRKYILELDLKTAKTINCIVIQEDIKSGQRIRKYILEAYSNGNWITIKEGSSVGHKRIEEFPPMNITKIRLRVTESVATPEISNFSLFNIKMPEQDKKETSLSNVPATLGDWDNRTFTTDWQDFRLDLTPYMTDRAGQFELKFRMITHDRKYEKAGAGGYGLEFRDWEIEMYGASTPDAIQMKNNDTFLVNNSQHITKETGAKVVFKTQVRTKPGGSVGTIELKIISFE
ncbi:MAG: alpha-L-fucosidase [Mangrovibacterium sp.]